MFLVGSSPLVGKDVGSGVVGSKSGSFVHSVTFTPMDIGGA